MEMKKDNFGAFHSKKAFAFTFLAFFLSIIIFAIAFMSVFEGDYAKDNVYKDSRITFVNAEIRYFKKTYLPNAISFSLYNTLDSLMNYTINGGNYQKINRNYSKFNGLMGEGMMHGSFDGSHQTDLLAPPNKTLEYFLEEYEKEFQENYKANFSFDVINLKVYETKPYYVDVKIFANLTIDTHDNISSWDTQELIEVSVPIYDLKDPMFMLYEDANISLEASEFNFPAQNWTIESFEETLNQTYSTVYFDESHKYSIGNSFLNKYLNYSPGSYKDVIGFWSFDYDLSKGGVYDTSRYSPNGKYFGNTRLALDFYNVSISGDTIPDITAYENNATMKDNVQCNVHGVDDTACTFDGDGDYLLIENTSTLNISDSFSISIWIKPSQLSQSDASAALVRMSNGEFGGGGSNDGFALKYIGSEQVEFIVGNTTSSDSVMSDMISSTSSWTNFVAVYNTTHLKLYQNGFLVGSSMTDINEIVYNTDDLSIGGWHQDLQDYFNGTIDEINIYSRAMDDKEVGNLYKEREIFFIDYIDSFHDTGINLDGKDDYAQVSQDIFNNSPGNFTVEFWFKAKSGNYSGDTLLTIPHSSNNPLLTFTLQNNTNYTLTSYQSGGGGIDVLSADVDFQKDNNYHIVNVYEDDSRKKIYVNGKLKGFDNSISNPLEDSTYDMFMGAYADASNNVNNHFRGVLDEIKIYNRSLSEEEIKINYLNYDSYAKGCCNYLMLVDPHKFGYNRTMYKDNISHSSKLFYDYHKKGLKPNVLLWNISALTSLETNEKYYNLLLDQCLVDAYNVLDYQNESINVTPRFSSSIDAGNCSILVKEGVY